nr:MAG TPA: hypothetical protein [Caudoviricetes sp.]
MSSQCCFLMVTKALRNRGFFRDTSTRLFTLFIECFLYLVRTIRFEVSLKRNFPLVWHTNTV